MGNQTIAWQQASCLGNAVRSCPLRAGCGSFLFSVVVSHMEGQACVLLRGHEGGLEREGDVSVGIFRDLWVWCIDRYTIASAPQLRDASFAFHG